MTSVQRFVASNIPTDAASSSKTVTPATTVESIITSVAGDLAKVMKR